MQKAAIAVDLFLKGYNCAQSVLYAFREETGLSDEIALKIACGFGAGMGHKEEVCGAVTGGILVLSLRHGRGINKEKDLLTRVCANCVRTAVELLEQIKIKGGTMSSHTTGQPGGSDNLWKRLMDNRKRRVNAWDNAQIVLADVPVNVREVKKILPLGLRPTDPAMATLFLINYPTVAYPLFPYKEAIMMIHVRTLLGQGRHCCWIIVDDDPALILGRELLGFPKKTGTFVFEENQETINASITRRGVTVMSMTASRGDREPVPPPVFNNKTFNYGGLGQFMSFSAIWMFRPREVIHESFRADIKLTVNDSEYDPLARLVAGEPRNGRIVTIDIPGGSPYMLPVGLAGPFVFGRTFNMRFR